MGPAINNTEARRISCTGADAPRISARRPDKSRPVSDRAGRAGISSYWRKNTSPVESAELANLLHALRKVAGYLGENVPPIEYRGMSTTGGPTIQIEPDMVMGCYPVPPDRVDELIGMIVHQAMHQIEWSDHVWKILRPAIKQMAPLHAVLFRKMAHTGEDIYVDQQAGPSVFGQYVRIARKKALERYNGRLQSATRSVDELFYLWQAAVFAPFNKRAVRSEYQPLLPELTTLSSASVRLKASSKRLADRCGRRAQLYLDYWEKLKDRLIEWPVIDTRGFRFTGPGSTGKRETIQSAETDRQRQALPPLLARQIEVRLAADAVDITPIIRSVVGYDDETVEPMSRWDFTIASRPVMDRKIIGRLKAIFRQYANRRCVVSRGLTSGRLDRRRLYRAQVTGRCFQQVDRLPNPDWCVTLLVDASGSMRGNKWQLVENTVANVHRSLAGYHNRLNAFAYFEVSGIGMISRLIKDNTLLSIPPAGQTASGQAIIAAASMIPGTVRRNILIHVTDGNSNFGCDVSFGIEFCRQKRIHLITLGCGCKDKIAMENQYGRTIQFVDYFEQLPQAVENLLKTLFRGGGRQRFKPAAP